MKSRYFFALALLTLIFIGRSQFVSSEPSKSENSSASIAAKEEDDHVAPLIMAREAAEYIRKNDMTSLRVYLKGKAHETEAKPIDEFFDSSNMALGFSKIGKNLHEVEFVEKRTVGKSVVHFVYLVKGDAAGLYWRLTFYKNSKEWLFFGSQISVLNFNPL